MAKPTEEDQREAKLAGIPESTRRIMERMVNTPPQPHNPRPEFGRRNEARSESRARPKRKGKGGGLREPGD